MNFRKRYRQESVGFQLVPIIDVLCVMLIFFVTTYSFARFETEMDVTVPTAKSSSESRRSPGEIIINIRKDGQVVLHRRDISIPELQTILLRVARNFPDQPVILRADEATPYKSVIAVLDACRQADVWNVSFATRQEETEGGS
jgi:biopolymer transport protein ExbD